MLAGIWLKREYLQGGVLDRQSACSMCNYESSHVMSNWKYCPICGTRMFVTVGEMNDWLDEQKTKSGEVDP